MLKRNGKGSYEIDWQFLTLLFIIVGGAISFAIGVKITGAEHGVKIVMNERKIEMMSAEQKQIQEQLVEIRTDVRWIKTYLKKGER